MALPYNTMTYLPPRTPVWQMGDMIAHGSFGDQYRPFSKIAYNGDVDNVEETVWPVGGVYAFPASAQQMEVVSIVATDNGSGTGARTVRIGYLDSTYAKKTETLTLNGVTAVPTVATDILRINSIRVITAGTAGVANGNIDVRAVADTPVYARILAGMTRGRNSVYTVPLDHELYITDFSASSVSSVPNHYCRFTLRANYDELAGDKLSVFQMLAEIWCQDVQNSAHLPGPIRVPETVDIKVDVQSEDAASSVVAAAAYRGYLEYEP